VGTRWFDTLRNPYHAESKASESAPPELSNQVLIPAATASWRAWLATGARRAPIDRRRARGSDARLKNILLGGPSGAVDFPSAMARQEIDEAMNELPPQHRQVLKLAYFAGLTNGQIAAQLGMTVSGVRRRLRVSLAIVGGYIERGRAAGRRAVHSLVFWLGWRGFDHVAQPWNGPALHEVLQAGVVAIMTVAAAAILIAHHTSPVQPSHHHKAPPVSTVGSAPPVSTLPGKTLASLTGPAAPAAAAEPAATVAEAVRQATTAASLPITIQVPAGLPVSVPLQLPVPSPSL
jgi:hypothetical protein